MTNWTEATGTGLCLNDLFLLIFYLYHKAVTVHINILIPDGCRNSVLSDERRQTLGCIHCQPSLDGEESASSTYLFVHLLFYPGSGCGGSRTSRVSTCPFEISCLLQPVTLSSSSWGESVMFPCQIGYVVPPATSWSSIGFFPNLACMKDTQRGEPEGIMTRCPNHPSWLIAKGQQLYIEVPLGVLTLHPVSIT